MRLTIPNNLRHLNTPIRWLWRHCGDFRRRIAVEGWDSVDGLSILQWYADRRGSSVGGVGYYGVPDTFENRRPFRVERELFAKLSARAGVKQSVYSRMYYAGKTCYGVSVLYDWGDAVPVLYDWGDGVSPRVWVFYPFPQDPRHPAVCLD